MGVGIACLYPSESHPWCHRLVCESGVSKLINFSPSLDRLVGLTYIKQSRQRRHLLHRRQHVITNIEQAVLQQKRFLFVCLSPLKAVFYYSSASSFKSK